MIRQAWRATARMPLVATAVVLSLAAGIGINTVVFSWIQSRLWKPMPGVPDGAQVHMFEATRGRGFPFSSWLEYEDLRDALTGADGLVASRMTPVYAGDPGQVERAYGLLVSDNYFSALRLTPSEGRFFAPGESAERAPVAVLSADFRRGRFGDAPVVGERLRLNGIDVSIIGVAPDRFLGTAPGLAFDIYLPASLAAVLSPGSRELTDRTMRGYSIAGRLKPGVSREQMQDEARAVMAQLEAAHPATNTGISIDVLPFWQTPRGPNRLIVNALAVLQILMLLVLLAVCGNAATLLLARASARRREIAVRLALGASQARIARLLLAETMLLALAGAAAGAAFAVWGTEALKVVPLTGLPIRIEANVDAMGLAVAAALGLLCGLIVGAVPAFHLSRMDAFEVLRSGTQAPGRSRARSLLMGAQIALAMLVLIAGATFVRAFLETRLEDTGFEREGVLLAAYDLSGRSAGTGGPLVFADRLLHALRANREIAGAAISTSVPLDIHGLPRRIFELEGRVRVEEGEDEALANVVTPGYFATMGIPILEGRDFRALTDPSPAREAIVNETFARMFVGDGPVIGRRIDARGGPFSIVAVVRDSLYDAFGEPPTPIIYFSFRERPSSSGEIQVRTSSGAEQALTPVVRAAVAGIDPDLPVFNVRTMAAHIDSNLVFRRVPARMFGLLMPVLIAVAALGIYAVTSYAMTLRTTEIGVRIAVGATHGRVVRECVAEQMSAVFVGAAIGWLIAFAAASDLDASGPLDLAAFVAVPLFLLAVAGIACLVPARRAARLDPWRALR